MTASTCTDPSSNSPSPSRTLEQIEAELATARPAMRRRLRQQRSSCAGG